MQSFKEHLQEEALQEAPKGFSKAEGLADLSNSLKDDIVHKGGLSKRVQPKVDVFLGKAKIKSVKDFTKRYGNKDPIGEFIQEFKAFALGGKNPK